jgi:hypothetical protein
VGKSNLLIPFHALFDESGTGPNLAADPRPLLDLVDVIIARDVMTEYDTVIFGRERLEEASDQGGPDPDVLIVALDIETAELPQLLILIEVVKGRHDYIAEVG